MSSWNGLSMELKILIIKHFLDTLLKLPEQESGKYHAVDCEPTHKAIKSLLVVAPEMKSELVSIVDQKVSEDGPYFTRLDPPTRLAYSICTGQECLLQLRLRKWQQWLQRSELADLFGFPAPVIKTRVPKLTGPTKLPPIPKKYYEPVKVPPEEKLKVNRDHFPFLPLSTLAPFRISARYVKPQVSKSPAEPQAHNFEAGEGHTTITNVICATIANEDLWRALYALSELTQR